MIAELFSMMSLDWLKCASFSITDVIRLDAVRAYCT